MSGCQSSLLKVFSILLNSVWVQAEKISQQQLFELLRVLLFWLVGIPVPAAAAELAIYLPNSRRLETEADVIGQP